ncbi:hypothetical protein D3C80_1363950 [compost metagenome]
MLVERRPRSIQGIGNHYLFLEQLAGLLERCLAALGQGAQLGMGTGLGGQGVLEFQGIVGAQFIQALQQVFKTGTDRRIEKALPQ